MFIQPSQITPEEIDAELQNLGPMMKFIRYPGALKVMYTSMHLLPQTEAPRLRYTILKLLERLAYHSHRNHAVLTNLDLVGPLFDAYCDMRSKSDDPTSSNNFTKPERQVTGRLLKRLLELGVDTEVAKTIFQRAISPEGTLDGDVLEILRAGMRTRWPEHLSLENGAAIGVPVTGKEGLPKEGFTFMVLILSLISNLHLFAA